MSREPIWSIASGARQVYFALFTIQFTVAIMLLLDRNGGILESWAQLGPIAIASAAMAIAVTEIGGYAMVLARGLEESIKRRRAAKDKAYFKEGFDKALEILEKLKEEYPDSPDLAEKLRRGLQRELDKGN